MAKNTNQANSFMKGSDKTVAELQGELKAVATKMNTTTKKLNIPKVFKASFGDPAMFSVNGVRVEIPLGIDMMVPLPHYDHAYRLMGGAVFTKGQDRPKPEDIYKK